MSITVENCKQYSLLKIIIFFFIVFYSSILLTNNVIAESLPVVGDSGITGRLQELAEQMDIPSTSISARVVGGVPIEINGVTVPKSLLTAEELKSIETAEMFANLMDSGDVSAETAPTSDLGSGGTTPTPTATPTATPTSGSECIKGEPNCYCTGLGSGACYYGDPSPASEKDSKKKCLDSTVESAGICIPKSGKDYTGLSNQTVSNTIYNVAETLLAFLAALSVLVIAIAGIMYITSTGDETRIDNAKKWLLYAIIGLVIALVSYLIVYAVGQMLGVTS